MRLAVTGWRLVPGYFPLPPSLLVVLIPVYLGLAVLHHSQGSCHLAWQCLQPLGASPSGWFFMPLAWGVSSSGSKSAAIDDVGNPLPHGKLELAAPGRPAGPNHAPEVDASAVLKNVALGGYLSC